MIKECFGVQNEVSEVFQMFYECFKVRTSYKLDFKDQNSYTLIFRS
jgi:hypothetical protein